MPNQTRFSPLLVALLSLFVFVPWGCTSHNAGTPVAARNSSGKVVYVCACLKTRSCACMTEAKTEGPCACGTAGGPPLKAVPQDSAWAKENLDRLAK